MRVYVRVEADPWNVELCEVCPILGPGACFSHLLLDGVVWYKNGLHPPHPLSNPHLTRLRTMFSIILGKERNGTGLSFKLSYATF